MLRIIRRASRPSKRGFPNRYWSTVQKQRGWSLDVWKIGMMLRRSKIFIGPDNLRQCRPGASRAAVYKPSFIFNSQLLPHRLLIGSLFGAPRAGRIDEPMPRNR
jgi:hypothetical protein